MEGASLAVAILEATVGAAMGAARAVVTLAQVIVVEVAKAVEEPVVARLGV